MALNKLRALALDNKRQNKQKQKLTAKASKDPSGSPSLTPSLKKSRKNYVEASIPPLVAIRLTRITMCQIGSAFLILKWREMRSGAKPNSFGRSEGEKAYENLLQTVERFLKLFQHFPTGHSLKMANHLLKPLPFLSQHHLQQQLAYLHPQEL